MGLSASLHLNNPSSTWPCYISSTTIEHFTVQEVETKLRSETPDKSVYFLPLESLSSCKPLLAERRSAALWEQGRPNSLLTIKRQQKHLQYNLVANCGAEILNLLIMGLVVNTTKKIHMQNWLASFESQPRTTSATERFEHFHKSVTSLNDCLVCVTAVGKTSHLWWRLKTNGPRGTSLGQERAAPSQPGPVTRHLFRAATFGTTGIYQRQNVNLTPPGETDVPLDFWKEFDARVHENSKKLKSFVLLFFFSPTFTLI